LTPTDEQIAEALEFADKWPDAESTPAPREDGRKELYAKADENAHGWSRWSPNEAYKTGFEAGVDASYAQLAAERERAFGQREGDKLADVVIPDLQKQVEGWKSVAAIELTRAEKAESLLSHESPKEQVHGVGW